MSNTNKNEIIDREHCIKCGYSVKFGSGRFVNRVPDCNSVEDHIDNGDEYSEGEWICPDCLPLDCELCGGFVDPEDLENPNDTPYCDECSIKREKVKAFPKLLKVAKSLICVCDDRISILNAELTDNWSCKDDTKGQIAHFEHIQKECQDVLDTIPDYLKK